MTRPMSEEREKLEPCPICGNAVEMTHHKGSDETGERWDYLAVQCQAKDHLVMCDGGDTAKEVAAAWNRRSTSSAERGMREALEWIRDHVASVNVTPDQRVDLIKDVARAALSSKGEG